MRRFLSDKLGGESVAPDTENCPLCRMWVTYVTQLAQAGESVGAPVVSFDREQAHAFLEAGFWLGVNKKDLTLCATHAAHQEIIAASNADTEPPKEDPS
jgi:hypothetical protein